MLRALPLLLLALLAAPLAHAAAKTGPDFVLELAPGQPARYEGPTDHVRSSESSPGERYAWNLTLSQAFTVAEIRARPGTFDVERVRQVVPMLENVPDDHYPLFHPYPDDAVWAADAPAQVFRYLGTPREGFTLRLGLVGPANVTLVLQRDVTPPAFAAGPVQNVTHMAFYQETRTEEPAIADLRIRPRAGGDWIENPTPVYHFRQRFPIQGLDPDTEYEARLVFTDWAGNEARSPVYVVRTAPAPLVPVPDVTALEPPPNATLPSGDVVIRARVDSPRSPIEGGDIRFFLDKREVREGLAFDGATFSYRPPGPLAPGFHSVSVEATNAAGGRGVARWSFTIEGAERESPAPGAPAALLALVAVALLARRIRFR